MTEARATSLKIVLLEDDADDAELIRIELKRHDVRAQWQHAATESEFRAALAQGAPDLVLADYKLPGFDGLAALKIVLEQCPDTPFIFPGLLNVSVNSTFPASSVPTKVKLTGIRTRPSLSRM